MKSRPRIIEGGGWTQRQFLGKPKARLLTFLAGAWLVVAFMAALPFWNGFPEALSGWGWLNVLLIIPEPVFIGLAVVFWITEERRLITQWHRTDDDSEECHWISW